MNDCHGGACGGHLSGLSIAQKILKEGFFSHPYSKIALMRSRSATLARCLHAICAHILPCYIWLSLSIPSPSGGLISWIATQFWLGGIIIVVVNYFMKWVEAMPMIKFDGEIATHFIVNQIITRFDILKYLFINHGRHFKN